MLTEKQEQSSINVRGIFSERNFLVQKDRLLTVLFYVFVAIFLIFASVFFVHSKPVVYPRMFPTSNNERFLNLQQKYTHNLEETILNLLEPLVGPGKVKVAVQLDLNLKDAQHNIRSYDPEKQPVITTTNTLEKEIQNIIQKQHVSVIVDGNTRKGDKGIYQSRTQNEMDSYRRLIQNVMGYNPQRGDTLEIQNMPFTFNKTLHRKRNKTLLFFGTILFLFAILTVFVSFLVNSAKNKSLLPDDFTENMLEKIEQNPDRAATVIKNWIYIPPSLKSHDWTFIQKAGIILLASNETFVRHILIALNDEEVRQISKTMASLGVIPPQESIRVLKELYDAMFSGGTVVGNPMRVQQILSENPREQSSSNLSSALHQPLWQELSEIPTQTLSARLMSIRPEISAYILYQFSSEKASELIQNFSEKKATQVLLHLSHIGHLNEATNMKMEEEALVATRQILDTIHTPTGSEKTSEILSRLADTDLGQTVIKDLSEKDPSLAHKLAFSLIRFEDLSNWPNSSIQTLLKNTSKTTALAALAGATESVKSAVKRNVPPKIWEQLVNEIQSAEKDLTTDQILAARKKIITTAQTLIQQEKITL